MADISMCQCENCPATKTCFRFLATPSDYQCYFIMSDEDKKEIEKNGKCSEYWECKTEEDLKKYDRYWRD